MHRPENSQSAIYTFHQTTFDFRNLEAYHGTAAFNLTTYPKWDDMLMDMLTRPSSVIVIQARRRGRGVGGWSKNNPYLEEVRV